MSYRPPPGPTFGAKPIQTTPAKPGQIKAWSYSTLEKFEKCPYSVYLSGVKKVPQESSAASERGSQIHQLAEDYVNGNLESLPKELNRFAGAFDELRSRYEADQIELEEDWAFDADWSPTGWRAQDCWNRMKLDVLVHESKTACKIIDHKTGKKWGNEFKHSQQGQLYAIGTFLKYPDMQFAEVSFWYLDKGETLDKTYTRDEAMVFLPKWQQRATKLTTCTEFIPRPSRSTCRFCPYGKQNGNAVCEWSE